MGETLAEGAGTCGRHADLETGLRRLSAVTFRDDLDNVERLHSKLGHGKLRVLISGIEAIMEWHDRFWPPVEGPEHRQVQTGWP